MVWERYNVTSMTLYRWLDDEAMDFPKPVYFGRFRYWCEPELEEWERARPRRRDTAKRQAAEAAQAGV
jgi:predicted DNA-binding transcriptional regulator AlpA